MRFATLLFPMLSMSCGEDPVVTPAPDDLAPARAASELLDQLETAYRTRSMPLLSRLVALSEHGIEFTFVRDGGNEVWDVHTFLRLHQWLFHPEDTPIEPPIPPELWLTDLSIELTPTGAFTERDDLLAPEGPLDPIRWRALGVECQALVFIGTQGETDYTIDGPARFIIVEDVQKVVGEEGKFLFFRIEDLRVPLEPPTLASTPGSLIALDR